LIKSSFKYIEALSNVIPSKATMNPKRTILTDINFSRIELMNWIYLTYLELTQRVNALEKNLSGLFHYRKDQHDFDINLKCKNRSCFSL